MSLPKPPTVANDAVISSLTSLVLTYEDLAKIMRCSVKTVRRLVSRDVIPHKRFEEDNPASDVRFYWPQIEIWLRGGKRHKGA